MDSTNLADVQTGFWTNHAYGSVSGATLTLSSTHGAYLVAFLAVFVQLCGARFWVVLCYIIFMLRSRLKGDGLHHQRQAIFRNTASPEGAITRLISTGWAWRGVPGMKWPMASSTGYALVALINLAAFLIAGIFSSRVTRTTSEVLVKPSLCGDFEFFGFYGYNKNTTPLTTGEYYAASYAYTTYINQQYEPDSIYSTSCVHAEAKVGLCTPIARKSTNFTQTIVDCPFDEKMCFTPAFRLDTGVLDSLLDFGINTRLEDRVGYRRFADCALLSTDGFVTPWLPYNDSRVQLAKRKYGLQIQPHDQAAFYDYGPQTYVGTNFTNILWKTPYNISSSAIGNSVFTINSFVFESGEAGNAAYQEFIPIPQLLKHSSDLSLTFLINTGYFTEPVDDPWLSAHEPLIEEDVVNRDDETTYYVAGKPSRVLACAERSQFCDIKTGICTNLTGNGNWDSLPKRQRSIAKRISYRPAIRFVANALSQFGLLSGNYCYGAYCGKLPDNQWLTELARYYGTSLVMSQYWSTSFVNGPTNPIYNKYWAPPTEEDRWMCHSQIAVRDDYASFSVLGFGLILGIGGAIVLASLVLETVLTLLHPKPGSADEEWHLASFTHLQRIAFESRGEGTWVSKDSSRPTTETKEILLRLGDSPSVSRKATVVDRKTAASQ